MGLDTFENAITDASGFGTAARLAPEPSTATEGRTSCDWCLRPVEKLYVTPETWSNLACNECYFDRFDDAGNDKLAKRIGELKAEIDELNASLCGVYFVSDAVRLQVLKDQLAEAERRF